VSGNKTASPALLQVFAAPEHQKHHGPHAARTCCLWWLHTSILRRRAGVLQAF